MWWQDPHRRLYAASPGHQQDPHSYRNIVYGSLIHLLLALTSAMSGIKMPPKLRRGSARTPKSLFSEFSTARTRMTVSVNDHG